MTPTPRPVTPPTCGQPEHLLARWHRLLAQLDATANPVERRLIHHELQQLDTEAAATLRRITTPTP